MLQKSDQENQTQKLRVDPLANLCPSDKVCPSTLVGSGSTFLFRRTV